MACGAFVGIGRADGIHECETPVGGHKTVKPPQYNLNVKNPGVETDCLWQDDDNALVQEDDGDFICIDEV